MKHSQLTTEKYVNSLLLTLQTNTKFLNIVLSICRKLTDVWKRMRSKIEKKLDSRFFEEFRKSEIGLSYTMYYKFPVAFLRKLDADTFSNNVITTSIAGPSIGRTPNAEIGIKARQEGTKIFRISEELSVS